MITRGPVRCGAGALVVDGAGTLAFEEPEAHPPMPAARSAAATTGAYLREQGKCE